MVPLLNHIFTNIKYNQLMECKTSDEYAADAGIQYATCKLYNDPVTYTQNPIQEILTINGRTVNITTEYHGDGLFSIISTASGFGCGKTTIKSYVDLSVGAFEYVVTAKVYLKISNSTLDSAPNQGGTHIYSNGDIEILGESSLVNGDATTVGTITKGKDKIIGTITEYAEPLQFPSVLADLYKIMAQEGGTHNGNLTLTGGTNNVGPLYINGDLEVKPGVTLVLTGPLYVVGDVKVEQGHIDGNEHILSEGNINMSGGGYGSESIPILVAIYGDIQLVGPYVDAVLYAPIGDVTLTNLQLFGSVCGNRSIVSNSIITYPEALKGRADLPGSELYPVTYDYE